MRLRGGSGIAAAGGGGGEDEGKEHHRRHRCCEKRCCGGKAGVRPAECREDPSVTPKTFIPFYTFSSPALVPQGVLRQIWSNDSDKALSKALLLNEAVNGIGSAVAVRDVPGRQLDRWHVALRIRARLRDGITCLVPTLYTVLSILKGINIILS
jgi:hypothetical protein